MTDGPKHDTTPVPPPTRGLHARALELRRLLAELEAAAEEHDVRCAAQVARKDLAGRLKKNRR